MATTPANIAGALPSLLAKPFTAAASLFDRGFDPARARKLPALRENGESNVRGLSMAGEIAGAPLRKIDGNRLEAAKLLGVSRMTFYNKIDDLDIELSLDVR